MKSQISFIALVLVMATAVLGFATVGPLRATPDTQTTFRPGLRVKHPRPSIPGLLL